MNCGDSDPSQMLIVNKPAQRRLLASPLRLEILEHFAVACHAAAPARESKPKAAVVECVGVSIAEVAQRMGRRPDSLYHHVRLLARGGLLVEAGSRKAGKRDETLYRPVARALGMKLDVHKPASVHDAIDAVAATFRMAEREMRSAIEARAVVGRGPDRNFFTRRMPVRLGPKALGEINCHIDAIVEIITREHHRGSGTDGQPCSLTIALLPMVARRTTSAAHGPVKDR